MRDIKKVALYITIIFALTIGIYMITPPTDNYQPPSTDIPTQSNNALCGLSNPYITSTFPPLTKEHLMTSIPYPQPVGSSTSLPEYFNWKNNNGDWTSPAKNQGNCGSCWAFSAIGALESAINIASHRPSTDIDLSEQYLLSCLSSAGDCGGGWMHHAMNAIYNENQGSNGNGINGCPIESCMPYRAIDYLSCSDKCDDWDYIKLNPTGKLWQIRDWGWTNSFSEDSPSDWHTIKTWLINYGPLSVDIYASTGLYNFGNTHHSRTDVYEHDNSGTTDHGVVLVGWKDDPSISSGGYWILKNSWHPSWGYEGNFFNVAYGCLGIATRCCAWVITPEWLGGDNPIQYVSSRFSFKSLYPNPGETIYFKDESTGPVTLWEWDFNADDITDSNRHNPTHTFSNIGDYPVKLTVWNEKGLNSIYTRTVSVKTVWPPIAVITTEYHSSNNPKVKFDGALSWDVDGYITQCKWDMDNGDIIYGQKPTYTFSNTDAIYNVTLTVTDDDGSTNTATCDIRIDITTPPTTILDVGYGATTQTAQTAQNCFKNIVSVYLIADDWTAVEDSHYRINADNLNQNFVTYSEPFKLREEGIYNIDFYSTDIYKNQEEIKSEQIILDFTLPSLNTPTLHGKLVNGCYQTPVTISLSGHDDSSGLNKILYIVSDAELPLSYWNEYNESFIITETGTHTLQTCAIDKAGNIFIAESIQINIDIKEYPSIKIINPDSGIYIKNKKILSFPSMSVILGNINIVVETTLPYEEMQIKYVEFYINNILYHTDTTSPSEYIWQDNDIGIYTILVKTEVNGYTDIFTDEITAFKLL